MVLMCGEDGFKASWKEFGSKHHEMFVMIAFTKDM